MVINLHNGDGATAAIRAAGYVVSNASERSAARS
jgi:hypothetical protein